MSKIKTGGVSQYLAPNVPLLGEGGEYEELKLRNVIKLNTGTEAEFDCLTPLLLSTC